MTGDLGSRRRGSLHRGSEPRDRGRSLGGPVAERILVVGHSAVTCLGRDMEATWEGLIAGRSGIRRHDLPGAGMPRSQLAGLVEGFGADTATGDPSVKLPVRSIHLAMAAARAAWAD